MKKWAKIKYFIKEDERMAHKHMQKILNMLDIKDRQGTTTHPLECL